MRFHHFCPQETFTIASPGQNPSDALRLAISLQQMFGTYKKTVQEAVKSLFLITGVRRRGATKGGAIPGRQVTMGVPNHWGGANGVTITFFNTEHLLPKGPQVRT